jgi:hypothetical protein
MILNGKRIMQRVVCWELLSAWKEPGKVDRRDLGNVYKKGERTQNRVSLYAPLPKLGNRRVHLGEGKRSNCPEHARE